MDDFFFNYSLKNEVKLHSKWAFKLKIYYAIVILAQLKIFNLKAQKQFFGCKLFLEQKFKKVARLGPLPLKYLSFKPCWAIIGWKLKEELANKKVKKSWWKVKNRDRKCYFLSRFLYENRDRMYYNYRKTLLCSRI